MRVLNFIWSLPLNIIKSLSSHLNLEPRETMSKMPRRRPLHTCASSCVTIAYKACMKVQDLDGPIGSTAKRVVSFSHSFFPFIYTMLHQWLALLSIIDDHILTIEAKIEHVFPQSTRAFDKIDGLVRTTEVVPQHIENIAKRFHSKIHQFPILDWIIVHLISCLNSLLSILTNCGSRNTSEKEISIDVNCNDNHGEEKTGVKWLSKDEQDSKSVKRLHTWKSRVKALEEPLRTRDSPIYSCYQSAMTSPVSDWSQEQVHPCNQTGNGDAMSCTYKEVLKKGTKEDDERDEDNVDFANGGQGL